MRRVALITDGWKRMFTYAWPAGILERLQETKEDVNLYIFNSLGNWSRDEGYNQAEYNIFQLPDFREFDGIIIELNNISSEEVLRDVIQRAKASGVPVVSITNRLEDFYYVGIDNYSAMRQVIAHLHEHHGFRDFWFLMGPVDNYESNRRLKGLMDYAQEKGIPVTEDRILHGNFDFRGGREGFETLWKRHGKLPDAVICVNDNVAVAVCETAASYGYHAPKDFCVTGFDNFDKAGFYIPSITTVGHLREEAAYCGIDLLLRIWAGEEPGPYEYTPVELICQESCGCRLGSSRDARRHLKNQIMDAIDKEEFDKEVLTMEAEMMQCDTVEEMMECISHCIPSLKCDALYLVLDEHINDYKNETEDTMVLDMAPMNSAFQTWGYPKKMYVTFSYEVGGEIDLTKRPIEGLFPMFDSERPRQNFLFIPIHFGERTVGYLGIRNAVYLMEKYYLFQITNALTRSMENLHKKEMLTYMNKRLSVLYVRDQLTGVLNRTGYKHIGGRVFRTAEREGRRLLVVFADMDRLKYINDTFGHEYGDIAIHAVARALTAHVPDDAIVARMGGDEFTMLLDHEKQTIGPDLLFSRIRETLKADPEVQNLPFPVEVSLGAVITEPNEKATLEDYVKQADARMYEEKVLRKANRRT